MVDLFEQVLHHIEGDETEIQNWETKTGIESYAVPSFGPDRWIERAALGRLMAIDLLAVILFSVRDAFSLEQERRIVESWAAELRKALSAGEIQARDPVTLLALDSLPDGWEWLVSIDDADKFIAARGMGWAPSERVTYLLEQSRNAGTRYLDPKTRQLLKHYWLAGYEPKQAAPAQNTATLAPVETVGDGPAPLSTGDIAHCFTGLRWDESGWKTTLGNKPKWLDGCVVIPGQRGVSERRWNPVSIGAALVQQGHARARNVRAKFQTVDLLRPWFDVWKTYEADNFDSE